MKDHEEKPRSRKRRGLAIGAIGAAIGLGLTILLDAGMAIGGWSGYGLMLWTQVPARVLCLIAGFDFGELQDRSLAMHAVYIANTASGAAVALTMAALWRLVRKRFLLILLTFPISIYAHKEEVHMEMSAAAARSSIGLGRFMQDVHGVDHPNPGLEEIGAGDPGGRCSGLRRALIK